MGEMKRILIIEDSPTVIEVMKLMLKDMNVKVFTAGSEFGMFQAIESFGKTVDLILMDITLKSENGLDLVSRLRENPRYLDLPVIVVTEHAKSDFVLRAKELQVRSFIRKPIEKAVFIQRLEEAIQIEPLPSSREPIYAASPDEEYSESEDEVGGNNAIDLEDPTDFKDPEQPTGLNNAGNPDDTDGSV